MTGETSEQASTINDLNQEELIRRLMNESSLSEGLIRIALQNLVDTVNADMTNIFSDSISSSPEQFTELIKELVTKRNAFMHDFGPTERKLVDKNQWILHALILEDPLTAQNLSAIIAAITDLHTRCWFIQQNRLSDLMDYAQTRDSRYLKEANLQMGILSHNSPALIDFIVNAGTIAGGAATLALALKRGIDAVVQTPLRYKEAKLKNEREKLDQQIAAQKAEAEKRATEQDEKIAAQKSQIELDKQQLELDRQRLQLQQDRVKIILEIATTVVM